MQYADTIGDPPPHEPESVYDYMLRTSPETVEEEAQFIRYSVLGGSHCACPILFRGYSRRYCLDVVLASKRIRDFVAVGVSDYWERAFAEVCRAR